MHRELAARGCNEKQRSNIYPRRPICHHVQGFNDHWQVERRLQFDCATPSVTLMADIDGSAIASRHGSAAGGMAVTEMLPCKDGVASFEVVILEMDTGQKRTILDQDGSRWNPLLVRVPILFSSFPK